MRLWPTSCPSAFAHYAPISCRLNARSVPSLAKPRPFSIALKRHEMDPRERDNSGLIIQRIHQSLGETRWGFMIFRCTYNNNEDWRKFMNLLNEAARSHLEYCGTEELMETLDWNVQEDRVELDGASKDIVRQRFKQWVAGQRSERSGETESYRPWHADATPITREDQRELATFALPRFNYCVQVDEAALKTVLEQAAADFEAWEFESYVNLINIDWEPPNPDEHDPEETGKDDPFDEGEEDVEGCKLSDVGWMRVGAGWLVPSLYRSLHVTDWETCYTRPPRIALQ